MPQANSNGICIEYRVAGSVDATPLLLIHGVGAQLIRWPEALLDAFVTAGFRVIYFDARDTGLSTHMVNSPVPSIATVVESQRRGESPALPYTLDDLAADAFGLLDALKIERAHVFGVSLGGMVAQIMAIKFPARVLSLNWVKSNKLHFWELRKISI